MIASTNTSSNLFFPYNTSSTPAHYTDGIYNQLRTINCAELNFSTQEWL